MRQAGGHTQEQLAEKSGLSYKFIGEIERGAANPSIETLQQLSKALDVDIIDLFGNRLSAPPATPQFDHKDFQYVRETVETLDRFLKKRGSDRQSHHPISRRIRKQR